jgi:hypothetical protein
MKGKIDKGGWLFIERAGKLKDQFCPYLHWEPSGPAGCGDWCPLFDILESYPDGNVFVKLCRTTLTFAAFSDERPRS